MMRRRTFGLLLLLSALVLLARPAVAADEDHWYVLEMVGAPAGWMHESVTHEPDRIVTLMETKLRIRRGSIEIEMTMSSRWIESSRGEPIELRSTMKQGTQSVITTYTFAGDTVTAVTVQGGRTSTRELPPPESEWLTPMSARKFVVERLAAKAQDFKYSSITGEQGLQAAELIHTRTGTDTFELNGRTIPVAVYQVTTNANPVPATTWYSTDGLVVDQMMEIPGLGSMRTRLSTRKEAVEAGAGPAPELLVSTFVEVRPPIKAPRTSVTARYRLAAKKGDLPEFPEAAAQRVVRTDEGHTEVSISINDNVAATDEERANAEYLGASPACDPTDPMLIKLTKQALRKTGDDPAERAEALRAFVHRYISAKNLDTAFATASEVARMRRGDCSEHGVLLCGLLRAADIPARVATGLVYADQFAGARDIFGWHMWTQALIDGKWVDYDATLTRRFDAAHILTGTSSLSETSGIADLSNIMLLLGNLEVEVLEIDQE